MLNIVYTEHMFIVNCSFALLNNYKFYIVMPKCNGKGPNGNGPMTGRQMGRCTNFGEKLNNRMNNEVIDDSTNGVRQGLGQGRRRNFKGFGRNFGSDEVRGGFGNRSSNRFGCGCRHGQL
ncbi:MAG: hypothetical protein BGO29_08115 [Bacteroidales bacterium 36-12]|nr:MAG: hypothetical protein BGO29_08115 [Bacteroidales bacterium 36-12]